MHVLLQGSNRYEFFHVNDVAFSPDGTWLAAALGFMEKGTNRWQGQVLVWKLHSDQDPISVHECRNTTRHVVFSPNGEYLIAPSGDWSVRIWQVGTWKEIACLEGHTRPMFALAVAPDGHELVSGSGAMEHPGEAIFWKFPSGTPRLTRPAPHGVWGAAYAPAGDEVALATNAVEICDLDGTQKQKFNHKNRIGEIAYAPDGHYLATLTSREIRLWNLASGKAKILCRPSRQVHCLKITPGGQHLVWGGADGLVHVWNLAEGQEQVSFKWEVGQVTSLAFSPQGMTAATGGNSTRGNAVVLWDVDWQ